MMEGVGRICSANRGGVPRTRMLSLPITMGDPNPNASSLRLTSIVVFHVERKSVGPDPLSYASNLDEATARHLV